MKRYVAAMIRSAKTDEGLTEENFKVGRRLLHKGLRSEHKYTENLKNPT